MFLVIRTAKTTICLSVFWSMLQGQILEFLKGAVPSLSSPFPSLPFLPPPFPPSPSPWKTLYADLYSLVISEAKATIRGVYTI